MSAAPRLPARVAAVVAEVERGHRLCKFLRKKATGETEVLFYFEPSGRPCGPASAAGAIKSGRLRPLGDGLFGSETTQSWAIA